jgi:hypothetical protein
MAKGASKSIAKTYKNVRSTIRAKTEGGYARAATLHADKTLSAAAKNAGLGGSYKVAKNAVQAEFSGNKKTRQTAKANLRKFARAETAGSASKAAATPGPAGK